MLLHAHLNVCASRLMHDLRQKERARINIKTSEKLHTHTHTNIHKVKDVECTC